MRGNSCAIASHDYFERMTHVIFLRIIAVFFLILAFSITLRAANEQEIIAKAKAGNGWALLELDKIPKLSDETMTYLRTQANQPFCPPNSPTEYSRILLAKRGDQKAFDLLKAGLKNSVPSVQIGAFQNLGRVGNDKAIVTLAEYIGNDQRPVDKVFERKKPFPTYQQLAIFELSKIVKNPVSSPSDVDSVSDGDVTKWKNWWKANREKYDAAMKTLAR
ncbi:HEAT repeat domain-containing protein [Oscillatoria amoena NRMC-F 0135]|nr:HEAT repeat domain-containing protein [Oscillatoria laete-virens]MDL5048160.1 HEAT repeat domain-containing protein [Oscillatoria amoena NRMC-F 0135]